MSLDKYARHTTGSSQWRSYGGTLGEQCSPKIVGVFIYYCNDVKKRPQRGCSIQLVATETTDAIMAISVQGNYVIEITAKIILMSKSLLISICSPKNCGLATSLLKHQVMVSFTTHTCFLVCLHYFQTFEGSNLLDKYVL